MNAPCKLILTALVFAGLSPLAGGCLGPSTDTDIYYGPHRDPWFQDDPWMDGPRWYGQTRVQPQIGVYLYPPRHWH